MTFDEPVLLVGNGPVESAVLAQVASIAKRVIAADGGAQTALANGLTLEATIGDMDSVDHGMQAKQLGRRIRIADQNTTDFDKCLEEVKAPLYIGAGFLGGRLDHELAALNRLVQTRKPIILISGSDIVFRVPQTFSASLPVGCRISFFPMGPVAHVESCGLRWEISTLAMAPDAKISSSNQIAAPKVEITNPDQPLLCILPRAQLPQALKSFNS